MFLDAKSWVYGKLTGNAPLTALVPSASILSAWPNTFVNVPLISYLEGNQSNGEFADDVEIANNVFIEIHVFTAYTQSTTPIAQAVDAVMSGLRFTLSFSSELSEPQQKVRHRVMKYNRGSVTAETML